MFIPIPDNLTNDGGDVLTVGLNYVPENRVFYSSFLQAKRSGRQRSTGNQED
ncbi:MAG: hypothetical protein R3B93_10785 [Bacteroidia bacterium]